MRDLCCRVEGCEKCSLLCLVFPSSNQIICNSQPDCVNALKEFKNVLHLLVQRYRTPTATFVTDQHGPVGQSRRLFSFTCFLRQFVAEFCVTMLRTRTSIYFDFLYPGSNACVRKARNLPWQDATISANAVI